VTPATRGIRWSARCTPTWPGCRRSTSRRLATRGIVDDGPSFADRAQQAGVDVRIDLLPGQQHTFQLGAGRSPEADEAIRRLAEWARPKLGL
jgi:acetyl esterase/lipase